MSCSTEERYLSASNTSNLRVIADKPGDADVMIASGWSPSHLGHHLMRLQSKPTRELLQAVHTQIVIEADRLNIANPDAVASAVIAWWLNRLCPVCHGRKFDKIENTPSLSSIECPKCHGTGEKLLPHGRDGRVIADWLDHCKHAHVGYIERRLRPEW